MSILLGISISDAEKIVNPEATLKTIHQLSNADVDVMLGYDEYSNLPFLDEYRKSIKKNLYMMKVKGFGLGKVRNSIAVEGWKKKFDCVVLMDSHMYFHDDIDRSLTRLCNELVAVPRQVDQKDIVYDVGTYLSFYSFSWGHISKADYIPMTTNPLVAWSYKAIDMLIQAQGMFTPVYYWGYEMYDPTISMARLGHWVKVIHDVKIGHWYREKGELGNHFDVRNNVPIHNEPFKFVSLIRHDPPYYAGIKHATAVYAAKHYKLLGIPVTQFGMRQLKVDPLYLATIPQEARLAISKFNSNAKYTILDVYKQFQAKIDRGEIVTEHKNLFF